MLRATYRTLLAFGFNPRLAAQALSCAPSFVRDTVQFIRQHRKAAYRFPISVYPCLGDRSAKAGVADWHYFHQDLYVAKRIFKADPVRHIDVGSRIDGFVAHVACFRNIEVIDIRPLEQVAQNITFVQADFMGDFPTCLENCCDSVSCLHALEHFGLGRYGDPIRYDGHVIGLANLHRLLKPGGTLYLSVPIGHQRIEFNAHRVFSVEYLLSLFDGLFQVKRVCGIDDNGRFFEDLAGNGAGFVCRLGCGIFELQKLVRQP